MTNTGIINVYILDRPEVPTPMLSWKVNHSGIYGLIKLHSIGKEYTPESCGTWCMYLFIHESLTPADIFERCWLPDEQMKFTPVSPVRVTHRYNASGLPFSGLPFSGGITYYEKHGHTIGHRAVQVGCDYNHSWDQERPFREFAEVLLDFKTVANAWLEYIAANSTPLAEPTSSHDNNSQTA